MHHKRTCCLKKIETDGKCFFKMDKVNLRLEIRSLVSFFGLAPNLFQNFF